VAFYSSLAVCFWPAAARSFWVQLGLMSAALASAVWMLVVAAREGRP
jgi:hypothetical protein